MHCGRSSTRALTPEKFLHELGEYSGSFAWRRLGFFFLLLPPKPDKPLKESQEVWDSARSSGLAHDERWIRWMVDRLWGRMQRFRR
jgi:hypothetical protein